MNADRFNDLLGLCPAIQFESPSSWLTRAALSQGVAFTRLAEHLGWEVWRDLDRTFAMLYLTGLPVGVPAIAGLEPARRVMLGLRESECEARQMLLSKGKMSRYRFCPHCLRSDSTPHMRQHWRFSCWLDCTDHRCLLEDACPHCGAAVQLPFSLVNAGPQRRGVADLSDCVRCKRSLTEAIPRRLPPRGAGMRTRLRNGRAAVAAMYEGWFQVQGSPEKRWLSDLSLLDRAGLIPHEI